jgi:exodeoxyribonuclease VII large subunit
MEQAISLYELNNLVRGVLSNTFCELFWIRAEMSDVRANQNGHCYLEFIEKDESNKSIVAKARGSIWSNTFRLLKAYFESETGQVFTSGLKVLVQVSVEFHELYGYSLNVHNIDPTYTLGDQAKNRALIIKQLEEEGVLNLNKELELPTITNRIAVISSPTAAGYEDFCNQLNNNVDQFIFYTHLFPAIMQGERTEASVIEALDRIYENMDRFDAVVIIRGGGATSELSSFDSYLLAANCAQFPLPIITGIGHERDDTVLDIVAHTRAKTPTAVAEFLVKKMQYTATILFDIQDSIVTLVNKRLTDESVLLNTLSTHFGYITKDRTKDQLNKLKTISQRLKNSVVQFIQEEKHRLKTKEQHIELISPENILKKGYTLTLKGNKIVKSATEVKSGDTLTNKFFDGEITSQVE